MLAKEGWLSSPIVVKYSFLNPVGGWLLGSGDVPHEELVPPFELDEADGEELVLLRESVLPRPADATLLFVSGGLKMPENLAKSSFVCASRPLEGVEPMEPEPIELSRGLRCSLGLRVTFGEEDDRPATLEPFD